MATKGDITQLLAAVKDGQRDAFDRLLPLVYDHLRGIAHRQLRRRRPGQTLETTALVNEAYLKLADQPEAAWHDRAHFLAVSAVAMRHILVDYARRGAAKKRGGDVYRVTLDEARIGSDNRAVEVIEIDRALRALEDLDPRLGRLVELRFFGGLTVEETAEAMALSPRTVKRDWRKARAILFRALEPSAGV